MSIHTPNTAAPALPAPQPAGQVGAKAALAFAVAQFLHFQLRR